MERIFSVDDILGTFWKVEGQGTDGGSTPSAAGVAGLPGGYPVSIPLPPSAWPQPQTPGQGQLPSSELQRPIPRTGSFQRINRVPSEWAFQDFLREGVNGGMPSILSHISSLERLPFTDSPRAKEAAQEAARAAGALGQNEMVKGAGGRHGDNSSDSEGAGGLEKKKSALDLSAKAKVGFLRNSLRLVKVGHRPPRVFVRLVLHFPPPASNFFSANAPPLMPSGWKVQSVSSPWLGCSRPSSSSEASRHRIYGARSLQSCLILRLQTRARISWYRRCHEPNHDAASLIPTFARRAMESRQQRALPHGCGVR